MPESPNLAMDCDLDQPVERILRRDFTALGQDLTVEAALAEIRRRGLGERVIYFYVVDAEGKLVGVLPTRRLLLAQPEARLGDLMVRRVLAIPLTATVLEACEMFVMHKFLAFPVVDAERRIAGVVDVSAFTREMFDLEASEQAHSVFDAVGFHLQRLRNSSLLGRFRLRFPWLLATITSGTVCALLASLFQMTLARSLVLAFFLTLVLGLGESVSVQTLTLTLYQIHHQGLGRRQFLAALGHELAIAFALGAACGGLVGAIVGFWQGAAGPAAAIGGSILLSMLAACFYGLAIPSLFHALRLDPKIASGPVTLAVTDISTVLLYFLTATALL